MKKKTPFRAWFFFRQGWSLYFAFILAAINTLTVTYFLAIENYPSLKQIFPTFEVYITTAVFVGIPTLVFIGYLHYRRSPAYTAEAGVMWTSNPYQARTLINGELNLRLSQALLKTIVKLSQNEKFESHEIEEIINVQKEIEKYNAERTLWNKKDFDFIHKLEKS